LLQKGKNQKKTAETPKQDGSTSSSVAALPAGVKVITMPRLRTP
jgi:hypothetical protein